jgi:putative hemolysin
MNYLAMAQSRRWLSDGHCLLVFPAGRVGIWRPDLGCVSDEPWDQMALSLGTLADATFVPIFVGGSASRFFSLMARYVYPWKLFGLVWEFLRSFKTEVSFHVGAHPAERLSRMPRRTANAWLRMRTYLLAPPRTDLHPEVRRYFSLHGFKDGELQELLDALEGRPDSQEALRRLAASLAGRKRGWEEHRS